ncbi:MAG: hypothetical protein QCI38_04335 [Candidatus Thermoplasmatota archaeon]|nr:hypothetical protein [Candidatus Thermoplasmatota archaeon]
MSEKKVCPNCGKRTMEKQKLPDGRYTWFCVLCGIRRGVLEEDSKRGVV